MKPSAFEYVRPGDLGEALTALSRYGDRGRILAGGQSLVPMMNLRLATPEVLIDINRIPGLDRIELQGAELVIGALARHATLCASPLVATHCPLMREAYAHVAHGPIRNRGTLAGNISHADPASEMPAVLLASDAVVVCRSTKGERRVAARDFFLGALTTALSAEEMVVEIRIPCVPAGRGCAFEEHSTRHGDFAVAAVAVCLDVSGGNIARAAVAAAGVEEHAARLAQAESALVGKPANRATFVAAAGAARASVDPTESVHADADYKRDLVDALTLRALERALGRCK